PGRTDTYTVIATSSAPRAVGPFSLTVRRPADKDAPLAREDALKATDPFDTVPTRSRRKAYEQKLDARHTYTLELTSTSFQPYLRVEDEEGRSLAQSGGSRVARLIFAPPQTKSYRIVASSRDSDRIGPFTLKVQTTDPREEATRKLDGRFDARS